MAVQVFQNIFKEGPKDTNFINTPQHFELKPPASIVQLTGTILKTCNGWYDVA